MGMAENLYKGTKCVSMCNLAQTKVIGKDIGKDLPQKSYRYIEGAIYFTIQGAEKDALEYHKIL